MEIGIGIHGEKGLHREDVQPINVIVERLLDQLYKEIEKTFNRNGRWYATIRIKYSY